MNHISDRVITTDELLRMLESDERTIVVDSFSELQRKHLDDVVSDINPRLKLYAGRFAALHLIELLAKPLPKSAEIDMVLDEDSVGDFKSMMDSVVQEIQIRRHEWDEPSPVFHKAIQRERPYGKAARNRLRRGRG